MDLGEDDINMHIIYVNICRYYSLGDYSNCYYWIGRCVSYCDNLYGGRPSRKRGEARLSLLPLRDNGMFVEPEGKTKMAELA